MSSDGDSSADFTCPPLPEVNPNVLHASPRVAKYITDLVTPKNSHELVLSNLAKRELADPKSDLSQHIANGLNAKVHSLISASNEVFVVHDFLTESEISTLNDMFPMYNLDTSKATTKGPHALIRTSRSLEELELLKMLDYSPLNKIRSGYQANIIDVGSNPIRHALKERTGIHCCCPILSVSDDIRKSNQIQIARTLGEKSTTTRIQKKLLADIIKSNDEMSTPFICRRRSQSCNVKAPFVMFLHSTYDLTPTSIADIMQAHSADKGAGSFLFNADYLVHPSGEDKVLGVRWRHIWRDGTRYIRFSFPQDMQLGYEHRLDTYASLLRSPFCRTSDGLSVFYITLESNRCGVQFFSVSRSYSSTIPGSVCFRDITLDSHKDKVLVKTWDFVRDGADLVPIKLVVPKVLFSNLLSYTMALPEGRFILSNVNVVANAFNRRYVIGGSSIASPERIPEDTLYKLSVAVYLICYVNRYAQSRVLSTITKDQESIRKRCQNFISAVEGFLARFPKQHDPDLCGTDLLRGIHLLDNNSEMHASLKKGDSWYRKFLNKYDTVKYPIGYKDLLTSVELETVINETCNAALALTDYCYFNTPNCTIYKPRESAPNLDELLPAEKFDTLSVSCPSLPPISQKHEVRVNRLLIQNFCSEPGRSKTEVDTPGDGNCGYHAFMGALGINGMNVTEFKTYLLSTNPPKELVGMLEVEEREGTLPVDGWMDDNLASYISGLYHVNLCIHTETNFRHYIHADNSMWIHIRHSSNHFAWYDVLRVPEIVTPPMYYFSDMGSELDEDAEKCWDEFERRYFDEFPSPSRLNSAKQRASPASCFAKRDALDISRSAFKIAEIQYKSPFIDPNAPVLDLCSNPGGFSMYLARCFPTTNILTHSFSGGKIKLDPHLIKQNNVEILKLPEKGDITSLPVFDSIVRQCHDINIMTVVADGASSSCPEDNNLVISSEVAIALSVLRLGGNFLLKTLKMTDCVFLTITHAAEFFDNVEVIKPLASHPHSSERFYLFRNYNKYAPVDSIQLMMDGQPPVVSTPKIEHFFNLTDNKISELCLKALDPLSSCYRKSQVDNVKTFRTPIRRYLDLIYPISGLKGGGVVKKLKFSSFVGNIFNLLAKRTPVLNYASTRVSAPVIESLEMKPLVDAVKEEEKPLSIISERTENLSLSTLTEPPLPFEYLSDPDTSDIPSIRFNELIFSPPPSFPDSPPPSYSQVVSPPPSFADDDSYHSVDESNLYESEEEDVDQLSCDESEVLDFTVTEETPILSKIPSPNADEILPVYVAKTLQKKVITFAKNAFPVLSPKTKLERLDLGVEAEMLNDHLAEEELREETEAEILSTDVRKCPPRVLSHKTILRKKFFPLYSETCLTRSVKPTRKLVSFIPGDKGFTTSKDVFIQDSTYYVVVSSKDILEEIDRLFKQFAASGKSFSIDISPVSYFGMRKDEYFDLLSQLVIKYSADVELVVSDHLDLNGNTNLETVPTYIYETGKDVDSYARNSCREFLSYCFEAHRGQKGKYSSVYKDYANKAAKNSLLKFSTAEMTYLLNDPEKFSFLDHNRRLLCGSVDDPSIYKFCFNGTDFVPFTGLPPGVYLVGEYCAALFDYSYYTKLSTMKLSDITLPEKVVFVQAGPGTGKTTRIVRDASKSISSAQNFLILCSTKEGAEDVRERLSKFSGIESKKYVRTMGSFLLNSTTKFEKIFVDEAMMHHAGAIVYSAHISQCKELYLVGDAHQIPFISRVPRLTLRYQKCDKLSKSIESLTLSYRIPADVAFTISGTYDPPLKTTNPVIRSLEYTSLKGIYDTNFPLNPKAQYLVFTQPEKKQLLEKFKSISTMKKVSISTVHEYQGKQSEQIILIRLNNIKSHALFSAKEHVIVALSRHTKSFIYASVIDDYISTLVKRTISTSKQEIVKFQSLLGGYKDYYPSPDAGLLVENLTTSPVDYVIQYVSGNVFKSHISLPIVHCVSKDGALLKGFAADVRRDHRQYKNNSKPFHLSGLVTSTYGVSTRRYLHMVTKEKFFHKPTYNSLRSGINALKNYCVSNSITRLAMPRLAAGLDKMEWSEVSAILIRTFSFTGIKLYVFDSKDSLDIDMVNQIANIWDKNGFPDVRNLVPTERYIQSEIEKIEDFSAPAVSTDPNFLQLAHDSILPGTSFLPKETDQWQVHHNDLDSPFSNIVFRGDGQMYNIPKFDTLRPVISTAMPDLRPYTRDESFLAARKRNDDVPRFDRVIDDSRMAVDMWSLTKEVAFKPDLLKHFKSNPISTSIDDTLNWLKTQDVASKDLETDFSLLDQDLTDYSFSIKRNPKPNLTLDAGSIYSALQTIVYHPKHINAVFCPIFRELKSRILSSLNPGFFLFTDDDPTDFMDKVNSFMSDKNHEDYFPLEADISKYDKSQGELALYYECLWMLDLGVPEFFVILWFLMHRFTRLNDRSSKLSFFVMYQRKSGDASTFLGNSMFLLAVIVVLTPRGTIVLLLFAGDDSLLLTTFVIPDTSSTANYMFNLEIKYFYFSYYYFCSKFVLIVDGVWYFVPDPVKILVKLGRTDIRNYAHLEEYRISHVDLLKSYNLMCLNLAINEALKNRYPWVTMDMTCIMSSIYHFFSTTDNLKTLFTTLPGDILLLDPSTPKLD